MQKVIDLPDAATTYKLGVTLGETLSPGRILLLVGALGTGKTTLIQGIGAGLGITDAIASPTFTLINEYPEGRVPLYHFDLYRLQPDEVTDLMPQMYTDGMEVEPGIVAIEWGDRLPHPPKEAVTITLTHLHSTPTEDARQLEITPGTSLEANREIFAAIPTLPLR
jgi:tRNA threonylcarbamoyladenosine biosynthesis protein TsaE